MYTVLVHYKLPSCNIAVQAGRQWSTNTCTRAARSWSSGRAQDMYAPIPDVFPVQLVQYAGSWWYGQGVSRTKRGGCGGVAGWKRWVIKLTIMSKVNRRRPCRRPMCVVVRNLHGESSRSAGGLGSQLDYMGPGLGWQQKDRLFRATIVRLVEVTTGREMGS